MRFGKLQILAAVLAMLFLGFLGFIKGWTRSRETTQYLKTIATSLNRDLPAMQDRETRAELVAVGPGKRLAFTFTMVNIAPGEGEIPANELSGLLSAFKKQKCGTEAIRDVLKRGAEVDFQWRKKDQRTVVADLLLTAQQCGVN
jgi:hypothetical protein